MHLMALRAFWRFQGHDLRSQLGECLNAPYGAPCFLALRCTGTDQELTPGLNAPYGAPCFLA